MSTDRDLLAKAVDGMGCLDMAETEDREAIADALLPVVDRIANERAAAELRDAAEDLATVPGNPYPLVVSEFLNDRAAALDPS